MYTEEEVRQYLELRSMVIETYRKYGDKIVVQYKSGRSYTGNEIAIEVEAGSDFGIDTVLNVMKLSIDIFSRDKTYARDNKIDDIIIS